MLICSVTTFKSELANHRTLRAHKRHVYIKAHGKNFTLSSYRSGAMQELQSAGLTHVHLLPSYDFGSVPEKSGDQQLPEVSSAAQNKTESGHGIQNILRQSSI